jgi:hypothetical protein
VIFFRNNLPEEVQRGLDAAAQEQGVELRYIERTDDTNMVCDLGIDGPIRLAMFYSPVDLRCAFGWKTIQEAILCGNLRQRKSLSGRIGNVQILDLFGWASSSLERFANALGVAASNKGLLTDEDKKNMDRVLCERPEAFLAYAADDARLLLTLHRKFVELIRKVQRECLGMKDADLWTEDNIPMTQGSLVARTLQRWIHSRAGEDKDLLQYALCKQGILDPDAKDYAINRPNRELVVEKYRDPETLRQGISGGDQPLKSLLAARCQFNGLNSASIPWWCSFPSTSSARFNALVHGGRCNNENPYEFMVEGPGLDVDIGGCYGDSLTNLGYPVGIPSVWDYSPNDKTQTLWDWLQETKGQLLPGLWVCVVSGKLPFEQDLVYSKLVKNRDVSRIGEDNAAEFALLRREIHNGVITQDVLDCLLKIATNEEKAALFKLKVVTAAAYLARDRAPDLRSWCERVLADRGTYGSRRGYTVGPVPVRDDRTRAWFEIPLKDFIGRLVEERRKYKTRAKDENLSEPDRIEAKGLDLLLKLMVNTVYGVLASPHFQVGNTILANNITARARCGVWMMAKALGLRQCITDGGIYAPKQVPCYRPGRKPGLDALSRSWKWKDSRRGRSYCPLGSHDWDAGLPPVDVIDRMAMEQIRAFWAPYKLAFPFQRIEHKAENSFSRAVYWSRADYCLLTVKGPVFAVRGKDKNKRNDWKPHPTFALFHNILAGNDEFPSDLTYSKGGILKVGKWLIAQGSKGFASIKGLRPGDSLPVEVFTATYNNVHFPLRDEHDYRRRRRRRKVSRGKPFQWFERYAAQGIRAVHKAMANNYLR